MALKWWPVGVIATLAFLAVLAAAMLLALPPVSRVLRPLANVTRLTRLPLYRAAALARYWSLVATAILLGLVFASAAVTSARPVGFSAATRNFQSVHPLDVMVCVGQPVADSATAGLLKYYSDQIGGYTTQRIGLTSPTLRVVPLTRDYDYARATFAHYGTLAGVKRSIDAKREVTDTAISAYNHDLAGFSRPIDYTDYAPSTEDVLALCMAGFPAFENKSVRRRALIYLGYTAFRGSAEQRPSLFSTQQVKDMAAAAGVQINGIARTDIVAADPHINDSLAGIAAATGGHFSVYNPAGTAAVQDSVDPTLASILDTITDNPPQAVLPDGTMLTQRTWDYPNPPLAVAVALAALLCVSLAVLRR